MKLKKGTLLFLLLTCLAYTTLAQEVDNKLDGNDVTIVDGIITGCKDAFSKTSIIIPEKIGETTITGIGDNWPGIFKDKNLVSVAFASDSKVTTIGYNAFRGNKITTLALPPSLTVIGDSAFYNNSLTSVTFNDDPNKSQIKSIGNNVFSGNTGLMSITLPELAGGDGVIYKDSNNQEYKPGDTFTNFGRSLVILYILQEGDVTVDGGIITGCTCSNKRILIPEKIGEITITGIGNAFVQKSLVAVEFADGSKVKTIGESAFNTNLITELSLPTTVTTIGTFAFYGNQITELTFPENSQLTTIGNYAFKDNEIATLTLPPSLETIGANAFGSNGMTELTIPENSQLTTIGNYAFGDNEITTLTLPTILTTIGIEAFRNSKITTLTLPTALTTIGGWAFHNNQITELTIPNDSQLKTIGDNAFQGNDGEDAGGNKITTLTLPPSLTVIGDSAFYNNSLTTVTFNDDPNKSQIQSIGSYAFSENAGLTGITLPEHAEGADVTYKDSNDEVYQPGATFTNFDRSLDIVIPPFYTLTADDVTVVDGIITECHCEKFDSKRIIIPVQIGTETITGIAPKTPEGIFEYKNLVSVKFADGSGVMTIGSNAFRDNQITELTFPDDSQLESIGEYAFYDNDIVTLTLPASLTTIENSAFNDNQITELTFPENSQLTTIVNHAFLNNKIAELTLPASLTTIGIEAFANNKITALTLPTALTTIGSGAFFKNQITELTFPNDSQLKTIGYNAFHGNDGEDAGGNKITTLTLPPSLMVIGDSAFYNNSLITVTFNDSNKSQIKSIGSYAFSGNTGLTGITLPELARGADVIYKDINNQEYKPGDTFTNFGRSLVILYILTADDVTVDDQGIITGCKNTCSNKRILIPKQIGDITITEIGDEAFKEKSIIAVAFETESQVVSIGNSAFRDNSITTLFLPTTLTSIGKNAFSGNRDTGLTGITLPKHAEGADVTYKDSNDQVYKPGDTFTNFERGLVTVIPPFYTLKEGDVTVDDQGIITKCNCEKFDSKRIIIPVEIDGKTITGIADKSSPDKGVFQDKNLVFVKFADGSGVMAIGSNAFRNNEITELTFPDDSQLESIGEYAFYDNDIVTLTLPTALTTIGEQAFANNPSLEPFTLPLVTIEGFRTYWKDGSSEDLGANPTINQANFEESFELVSIEQVTLTVEVNNEEGGSIEPSDDHFAIDKADAPSTQDLTATPADGWRFDKWVITSGEDEDGNPITETVDVDVVEVTVDADKTATAHFVQLVTLTTSIEGQQGGTISAIPKPSLEDNQYDIKTKVTLTATPADGWRFDKWVITGEEENNDNPTDVTVDVNKTATAHFVEQVTLTTAVAEQQGGTISAIPNPSLEDNQYDIKTEVTLTATPQDGWKFDKWEISDEQDKTDNPTIVTVDADKTATAHFVQQVTLTLTIEETLGEVNGLNAGENKIDKGADFELKATPASGQKFVSWTIDGKTIDYNPHTLTTTEADIGITVTFEAIPQQVTLTLDIEGEGSINPLVKPNSVDPDNEMKGMYDINTEIELTATPNEGWRFDKWVISDEENKTDKTTTITLDKNKSVTAHFVEGEEAITSILTEVVSANPYPNPVTSQITLKAKDGDLIQLFSPKGKQQYSTQHTGNEAHTIDVSTIPVGVYLVRITDAEGNTTTKRIVKK